MYVDWREEDWICKTGAEMEKPCFDSFSLSPRPFSISIGFSRVFGGEGGGSDVSSSRRWTKDEGREASVTTEKIERQSVEVDEKKESIGG